MRTIIVHHQPFLRGPFSLGQRSCLRCKAGRQYVDWASLIAAIAHQMAPLSRPHSPDWRRLQLLGNKPTYQGDVRQHGSGISYSIDTMSRAGPRVSFDDSRRQKRNFASLACVTYIVLSIMTHECAFPIVMRPRRPPSWPHGKGGPNHE